MGIPEKGTPQGGILSPLLAYVVLNELDWWIASQWEVHKTKYAYKLYKGSNAGMYEALRNTNLKEIHMVRYADDFKIFCRHRSHAERIFAATQKWLWERLSLEISPEKSRITNLRKGYSEFLGIKIKVRPKGKKSGRNTKKKRFVVSARLGDKAKGKILHEVRKQVKSMQNPKPVSYTHLDVYKRQIHATAMIPRRNDDMHERTVGGIRILSDADIYPFLSGSVDRVQMLSAGSPVPAAARLEMSNHDANAGLSGNVDDLIQSFRHVVGLITHVHVKQTVVGRGRFGQRDQLLRGLVPVSYTHLVQACYN